MQIDKKIIGAFVLGIFVAVFVYQAYTIYQIRDMALNNQAAINQIVNFINAPQQPQGETQPGGEAMPPMMPEEQPEEQPEDEEAPEGELPLGE